MVKIKKGVRCSCGRWANHRVGLFNVTWLCEDCYRIERVHDTIITLVPFLVLLALFGVVVSRLKQLWNCLVGRCS